MSDKKICVFLSSHSDVAPAYIQATHEVGEWIGRNGHSLVYGGARKGLMEVLAQTTKQHGGRVYGVVPQILVERGLVSDAIDVTFYCADLSDRKATLVRESDVIVALPGGIGTLDEVFTVLASNTIGISRRLVVLYNVEGCWDTLLTALNDLREKHLVSDESLSMLHVVSDIDGLSKLL